MRRKLFTAASVVSLLLCVATVVLWVWSMWYHDSVHRRGGTTAMEVISGRGRILIMVMSSPDLNFSVDYRWEERPAEQMQFADFPFDWRVGPFAMRRDFIGGPAITLLMLPHWFPAILFAALPLYGWIIIHKRRRCHRGDCSACGYDLTGNTSGVCPECGTAVTAKAGT